MKGQDEIQFLDAARNHCDEEGQVKAWALLQQKTPGKLKAEFAALFRSGPPRKPLHIQQSANPLPGFPFFDQKDNGFEAWRQCQTSSIAMCLKYMKVKGINTDIDYLRFVNRHGDTINQESHKKALAGLGVKANFATNRTIAQCKEQIDEGRPVCLGVLHHGPASAPIGGGHYIVAYGYDESYWRVMDPFGDIDLVAGGLASMRPNSGKALKYSFRHLNPRVFHPNDGNGWAWFFD